MSAAQFFADTHAQLLAADGDFFGAFSGTYTLGATGPLPVRVMRDDGTQQLGEFAQFADGRVLLTLSLEDVPDQRGGATVAFGAESYRLDQLAETVLGSHQTWVGMPA